MKILISVLGKPPEKYREVNWLLESDESVKARIPAQALALAQGVHHVLLLIPDSLGQGKTYAELQQAARRLRPDPLPGDNAQWHPIVLPARYSPQVEGDVRDFYQAALLFLAQWFTEHLPDATEEVDILLDASTGLNILQLFAYRVAREVAGALAFFRRVTLQVYNADPVGSNTQQAEIFLTEDHQPLRASLDRVRMGIIPRLAELYNTNAAHPGSDAIYRNLRDALNQAWSARDVAAFLNAVHYGIPLGIMHWFHEDPKRVFQDLEKIYQYVLGRGQHKSGRFVRPVRLGPDVAPYALAALLSWQLQQRWDFFTAALKCAGATYAQIQDFMEQMYRDHPVILNRFQSERTIQPNKLHCFKYPSLLSHCISGEETTCDNIDKRNFFAHAGFERCAVEVLKKDKRVLLRYTKNKLKTIRGFLLHP